MSAEARALFDCLSLSYLRYRILDLSTVASHRFDLICCTPYFPLYLYLHYSPCTIVVSFTQCIITDREEQS